MKKTRSEVSQERIRFYLLYTLIFGLFAIVFFSPFTVAGKSLIWKYDGLSQHFNAFVYLGDWVREILHNLFVEHQLIVPMWEFGIGYGADVFSTLQYYVLGDPIALLSVITPAAHAEVMYGFAIVLRLYLAGLVFCAFCRKMNCGRAASLCGASYHPVCYIPVFLTLWKDHLEKYRTLFGKVYRIFADWYSDGRCFAPSNLHDLSF